jgi:hypothetical protein
MRELFGVHAKKKRSAEPDRSQNPDQGAQRTVPADAPFRERGSSTVSLHQEPEGSGWSFFGRQQLDARASFKLSIAAVGAALISSPCNVDCVELVKNYDQR